MIHYLDISEFGEHLLIRSHLVNPPSQFFFRQRQSVLFERDNQKGVPLSHTMNSTCINFLIVIFGFI